MISITDLISNYPLLHSLASSLSTLDLYHLALTCKTAYSFILSSSLTFKVLRRNCLCDGHGLADRQAFKGLYSMEYNSGRLHLGVITRRVYQDVPIEVRLFGLKCDQNQALPCRKCGVNICEECRYYPREQPLFPNRRPHLTDSGTSTNVMGLCAANAT